MQNHFFSDEELGSILKQLLQAVHYIHSKNTFHRDIKPENILLDGSHLYLCDFGFTAFYGKDEERTSLCGTRDYLCPEIAMSKP